MWQISPLSTNTNLVRGVTLDSEGHLTDLSQNVVSLPSFVDMSVPATRLGDPQRHLSLVLNLVLSA